MTPFPAGLSTTWVPVALSRELKSKPLARRALAAAARRHIALSCEQRSRRQAVSRREATKNALRAKFLSIGLERLGNLSSAFVELEARPDDEAPRQVLAAFDQAFAALIRDLESQGLLDTTLVMVSSSSSDSG